MGPNSAEYPASARTQSHVLAELARGDRAAGAVIPVLRHLLASEGPSLVNEAVVARVRGMLRDLAQQLYHGKRGPQPAAAAAEHAIDAIAQQLATDAALLAHIHNFALEGQLAERFEQRLSLDPVLSPLLQELIASDDAVVAELAMNVLSAQARFMQSQRRMELPLAELPADLLSTAIRLADGLCEAGSARDLAALQASYDEAATRLGLLERLVAAMRRAVVACLAFERAGLALFASGIAAHTGAARAQVIISCNEQQTLRLALALRGAGLDPQGIERQLAVIGGAPSPALAMLGDVSAQQALQYLAETRASTPEQG